MTFGDDWLSKGLPTYQGGKDRTQARKMLDGMGGPAGFKKLFQTNQDGGVTMVHTKGDMPPQVSRTVVETDLEIKGLIDDHFFVGTATEFLPSDTAGDVCGETYAVQSYRLNGKLRGNALITGQQHWFNKEELGENSWVYVDSEKNCWLVTKTALTNDLTSITLEFRAMPTASKISPSRTLAQTLVVSGVGVLDPAEDYPGHAMAQVEDIATNGGKVILVNASNPYIFDNRFPEELPYEFEIFSTYSVRMKGRYVYLASELIISGIPPAASGILTNVLTTVQCRGTYTRTSDNLKQWDNLVVGLRYDAAMNVETVTHDVLFERKTVLISSTPGIVTIICPIFTGSIYEYLPVDFPANYIIDDIQFTMSITQEGVTASLYSSAIGVIPYWVISGDGYIVHSGGEGPVSAEVGYTSALTLPVNAGLFNSTRDTTGKAGLCTWPVGSFDGLEMQSDPTTNLQWFFESYLEPVLSNTYRPEWDANLYTSDYHNVTGYFVDDIPYGFYHAYGSLGAQKYANRVFGIQFCSFGCSYYTSGVYDLSGPNISFPACMGGGVYSNATDYPLPQFATPYVIPDSRLLNAAPHPTGLQYPTKENIGAAPTAGTSRVISPQVVVSPDNVAYVHYFK